ncbi:hypothetical protein AKUG0803_UNKNOWN200080 (plasmid) [Apilactobacillus kunkeei]|nr:hypothetical protein AKUG0103_UNKNOWN200080 [Apilactobacillus kunkeei]CAI2675028.1 hypothetical protein AKUG0803_UNKNOWN200080 [Apilactobacillus kunkeei]CAI2676860.1 hypothetical protein AKUG0402_UNKNOWN200080 [Apilactobacillus kunkeei]CAI2699003.1 hypothetical protein AKUG0602_UNKNOWN200100 [Apilactobacillus kunkeei]CAI2700040.1 hypothetical protein AKUG0408_UNKNOWN200080 [Apilactobacillus kunkeei]
MKRNKLHNDFEPMGKIMEDINTYCEMYEKSAPSAKSVRRWLDGKYAKSKVKTKARTKNTKSQTKYYMDDVAEILRIDHDIDINEAEDYSTPGGYLYESLKFNREIDDEIDKIGDEYVYMHKHMYDTDKNYREKVDSTMHRIKTSMMLNLMLKGSYFPSRLYEANNIRILSSAMQYVDGNDNGEITKAINEDKVLSGDLSYYLYKA